MTNLYVCRLVEKNVVRAQLLGQCPVFAVDTVLDLIVRTRNWGDWQLGSILAEAIGHL